MGGGGGSGRGLTPDELGRLEQKAKESLKDGAGTTKCNVFLSFASEDLDEVNLLRGQAKNEDSDIEFNDWSLNKPFDSLDAEYIRRGIRERIRQCSVTIVYVSDSSCASKWVDWEIRESIAMGKGVVAMYSGNKPPRHLPPAVVENDVPVVPWNHKKLREAIEEQSKTRS